MGSGPPAVADSLLPGRRHLVTSRELRRLVVAMPMTSGYPCFAAPFCFLFKAYSGTFLGDLVGLFEDL